MPKLNSVIRTALAVLCAGMFAASAPAPVSAQNCVAACLGKDGGCLPQCLSQQPEARPAPARQMMSERDKGAVILHCTQLPVRCSSNSDCTCSGCCGDMAGVHVCQPSC